MTSTAYDRPVRVFRVATSITMNTIMRRQLALLREAGLSVTCVCDEDEWTPAVRALGVRIVPLGMGRRPNVLQVAGWSVRFYRLLRRERPDVVHLHNAFHGFVGRPVARLAGVPVVIQTVHNWWYLEPRSSPRASAYRLCERVAASFCDGVLFINRDDVRRARAERIVPPRKAAFVGNGINTRDLIGRLSQHSREASRRELDLDEDMVAITMIARLELPKDHATLLQAFSRLIVEHPRAKLLLAGQGLDEEKVRELGERLQLGDAVRFLGHVPDVAALLKASDVLVLTSHCEGFGRALVEGMVARLPVVGSDVVGIRDVIRDDETGVLCPPHDPTSLCDALSELATDGEKRARLGAAGYAAAVRNFDESIPAHRTLSVYETLLARPRGARRRARLRIALDDAARVGAHAE
jgi:glycosyltransferase involved in cell wall biosynthesis